MLTVGLDVHKQFTYACILNDEGAVVHTERFDSTPQAIEQFGQKRLARDWSGTGRATTAGLSQN